MPKRNEWTVMVYLGGDNNLAEEMVYALRCMERVGSRRGKRSYEVFALYDGGVGPTVLKITKKNTFPRVQESEGFLSKAENHRQDEAESRVEDAESARKAAKKELGKATRDLAKAGKALTQLKKGTTAASLEQAVLEKASALSKKNEAVARLKIVEDELSRAKKEVHGASRRLSESVESVQAALTQFVVDTIQEAPAHHYMLVLSGHGSGAVGDFLTGNKRFAGLSIPDLREALTVIQEVFLGNDKNFTTRDKLGSYLNAGKIDILGLDSCVMGMAEVAYEVRECVQFLVGAEGFEPNTGWPFDRILDFLRTTLARKKLEAGEFAKRIVEEYINSYLSDYTLADVSTHLCALDLDKIQALASGLGRKEGLLKSLRGKAREDLQSQVTLGSITAALQDYIGNIETQKLIEQELQYSNPDLRDQVLAILKKDETQYAILQVAEELPSNLLREALADKQTQTAIEALQSDREISKMVKNALSDNATKAALEELTQKRSALLRKVLADVGSQDDIKKEFEGFDELLDIFKKTLIQSQADIKRALGGAEDLSALLNETLNGSGVRDAVRDALEWDEGLSGLLREALQDIDTRDALKNVILQAHWEAQGYKFEQHTDIWDFCDLLKKHSDVTQGIYGKSLATRDRKIADICGRISRACERVKRIIEKETGNDLVLRSDYCGPAFQHSHGISIFFPWARFSDASGFAEMEHYGSLEFAKDTQWNEFVTLYHKTTQRNPRGSDNTNLHPSKLNFREGLFTAPPAEFGTPLSVRVGRALTSNLALALTHALSREVMEAVTPILQTAVKKSLPITLFAQLGTTLNQRLGDAFGANIGTSLNKKLGTALQNHLGQVTGSLGKALNDGLKYALEAHLSTALGARLATPLNAQLGTPLNARIENAFNARLGTPLNGRLGTPLNGRLGTPLNGRLGTPLNARLGTPLNGRLGTPLNGRLGTPLNGRLGTPLNGRFGVGGGGTARIESMKNPPIKW